MLKTSAIVCGFVLLCAGGLHAADAVVSVRADRINCRYATGEVARLTVSVSDAQGTLVRTGDVAWSVDGFGGEIDQPGKTVDLSKENPFAVSLSRSTPGFARLRVKSADARLRVRKNDGNPLDEYAFGVAFAPERIATGTPEPTDFDVFWHKAIADLDATVPVDAKVEPMPGYATATMNCFRVSFATAGGRRVYGWLTEPKDLSKGPYPVRIRVPGAGIGFVEPQFCEGCVCLAMNVHSYAQPEGEEADAERQRLYDGQDRAYAVPCGVKRYCEAGIHLGREQYFYYASILGINRAVNWLAARPECNLKDFSYSGTSQGGGFGLCLTALNRHITRSCIFVPALTDLLGFKVEGRQSGWPRLVEAQKPENRASAERWAPYFCGVNFARRIMCPIRFVAGFSDGVCSPNAVYSAYNACPSEDKRLYDGVGMGHRVYQDFYTYLDAWERSGNLAMSDYRFLAFNIWGDYFGNPPHERDVREAALVKAWNADFVAFQEVTPNFWQSRLFTELGDTFEVVGRGMGPDGIDAYVPLAYRRERFDLVEKGAEWFCRELDLSKGMVWAVVAEKATGRRFAVFSSHFWWQDKGVGDDWVRLDNARRLTAKMLEIASRHDAAIIGGGDLNAPSDSWAMKHLVDFGWADAQLSARISPQTFPTDHYDPRRDANGIYVGVPAVRGIAEKIWSIDHIFYDPKRISAERFDLDITPEACALSDHHPIAVEFSTAAP